MTAPDPHQTAEALLAAIVSSSDDAIVSKTLDGIITSWNAGAERLFGWTAEEAVGKSIHLIVPPERREEEEMILQRIRRGERIAHFETERVANDGRRLALSLTISPLHDASGRVIGASKVGRDITDRRAAERAVRRTQELLRLIVDNVPALISYIDRDFVYRLTNRAYENWFGRATPDVTGKPVREVLGEAAWRKVRPYMEAALAGERVAYEERIPYPAGPRWVQASYVPDFAADGSVAGFATLVHDVDARRRSEEAQRLLVALHDATLGLDDPAAVVLEIVTGVGRHFGALRCAYGEIDEELRELRVTPGYRDGVPSVAGVHPLDRLGPGLVAEVLAGHTTSIRDLHADPRTNDPTSRASWDAMELRSLLCAPIVKAGRPIAVLVIGDRRPRDWAPGDAWLLEQVAERTFFAVASARAAAALRESRDELRRLNAELSEADRRKDEFLALLAHELRNPLAPISNAVQVLNLADAEGPTLQRATRIVERQVRHLSRLVDDLLDVSRIGHGRIELRREPVTLAAIVAGALEASRPLVEERSHRLSVSLPTEPVHVFADPTRLEQVLQNLVNNAARYTPAGGRIEIVAEQTGDEAVLRVRDDGTGIPPDMLARIFEPFTQLDRPLERSAGGLGMGLTLVRRLVELHGGRVEAHSEGLGRGSEFVVRLPALAQPAGASRPALRPRTPLARPLQILVVDDNVDAADSMAALLRVLGHDVRTVYDGHAAIEAAHEVPPDVALLDIGLPGLDGYEVAREIRRRDPGQSTALIALTGWGQEEDRRRSREAGFAHHLVKPVEPAVLRELLDDLARDLERFEAAAEPA